jgi:hypothetical protein
LNVFCCYCVCIHKVADEQEAWGMFVDGVMNKQVFLMNFMSFINSHNSIYYRRGTLKQKVN